MATRRDDRPPIGLALGLLALATVLHGVAALALEGVIHRWGGAPLPKTEEVMEVSLDELPDGDTEESEQIIQNDQVLPERDPKDSKRLAERSSDVERETVQTPRKPIPGSSSRNSKASQATDAPKSPNEKPSPTPGEHDADAEQPKAADGEGASTTDPLVKSDSGSMEGGGRRLPGGSPLIGNRAALEETFGRRGSSQHAEVPEGDETALDARKFKYASFFNRVRDAIADEWDPERVHGRRDPDGSVYGTSPRTTRLRIVLEPDGSVRKIGIETSSGLDHLDDEAIRAVRSAAPFVNPPPQLVDEQTGVIDFDFGFILTFDGQSRIFRYRR